MEPFLRWAGGKSWLIKHLNEIIGDFEINHYHEIKTQNLIQSTAA